MNGQPDLYSKIHDHNATLNVIFLSTPLLIFFLWLLDLDFKYRLLILMIEILFLANLFNDPWIEHIFPDFLC